MKERQALPFFTQWQQHYHTVTQLYYRIFSLDRNLYFFNAITSCADINHTKTHTNLTLHAITSQKMSLTCSADF